MNVVKGAAILFTSLQLRLAEPYQVVQRKLPTYTMWYGHCHLVSGGPGYVIGWTIPHGSTRIECCPEAWNLSQCCFIFLHNTDDNMLCRLFDDCKYMDIYIYPYTSGILLSWKTKKSLYFLASACEHLWPSHLCLVNCAKCEQIPSKYVADWSVWKVF